MMKPFELLVEAVIRQAAKDYRRVRGYKNSYESLVRTLLTQDKDIAVALFFTIADKTILLLIILYRLWFFP